MTSRTRKRTQRSCVGCVIEPTNMIEFRWESGRLVIMDRTQHVQCRPMPAGIAVPAGIHRAHHGAERIASEPGISHVWPASYL